MEGNGSGWSEVYSCFVYTGSIDCFFKFIEQRYPNDAFPDLPDLNSHKSGFFLSLLTCQILDTLHNDHILLRKKPAIQSFCLPPASLSTLQDVNGVVDRIFNACGAPDTDRDSLVRLLLSFGSRYRERSFVALVPLYFSVKRTTVLHNEAEDADWLGGGTMDSVIVKTLGASGEVIMQLEKTSFEGSSSKMENCMVCLEGFEDGKRVNRLPCSHEFHHDCIVAWLNENNKCPICRFSMPWIQFSHQICDENSIEFSNDEPQQLPWTGLEPEISINGTVWYKISLK